MDGTVGFSNLTSNVAGVTASLCLDSNNQVTRNTENENCVASSRRFKHNIETLMPGIALATLKSLRPVSFEFNGADGKVRHGFIAEEVELVNPQLVSYDNEGLVNSVHYLGMIPFLTQAIQELNVNLETIASTTATSTPTSQSFAESFFGNIFTRVTQWLADAANGIGDVFANTFRAKEKICVEDECLTKDDIRALLDIRQGRGANIFVPVPVPMPIPTPVPTPTPVPVPEPEDSSPPAETPAPASELDSEFIPEPTPEPVPEPEPEPEPEDSSSSPIETAPVSEQAPGPVPEPEPTE